MAPVRQGAQREGTWRLEAPAGLWTANEICERRAPPACTADFSEAAHRLGKMSFPELPSPLEGRAPAAPGRRRHRDPAVGLRPAAGQAHWHGAGGSGCGGPVPGPGAPGPPGLPPWAPAASRIASGPRVSLRLANRPFRFPISRYPDEAGKPRALGLPFFNKQRRGGKQLYEVGVLACVPCSHLTPTRAGGFTDPQVQRKQNCRGAHRRCHVP